MKIKQVKKQIEFLNKQIIEQKTTIKPLQLWLLFPAACFLLGFNRTLFPKSTQFLLDVAMLKLFNILAKQSH